MLRTAEGILRNDIFKHVVVPLSITVAGLAGIYSITKAQNSGITDLSQMEQIQKTQTLQFQVFKSPAILENPEFEQLVMRATIGSTDPLLKNLTIRTHKLFDQILEKGSYGSIDHFFERLGITIFDDPKIDKLVEKSRCQAVAGLLTAPENLNHSNFGKALHIACDGSTDHLLKDLNILKHPSLAQILAKASYGSTDHLLKDPNILKHPLFGEILEKASYGSTDDLLKDPDILKHPLFGEILEKASYGSTDHLLKDRDIWDHHFVEQIRKKAKIGPQPAQFKDFKILKNPLLEEFLEKAPFGSTDHLLQHPRIMNHKFFSQIAEKGSPGSTDHLLKDPQILERSTRKVERILKKASIGSTNDLLKTSEIQVHTLFKPFLKKGGYGSTDHMMKWPRILDNPYLEEIIENVSYGAVDDLLKEPKIWKHPLFREILRKAGYGSTDHLMTEPDIQQHPYFPHIYHSATNPETIGQCVRITGKVANAGMGSGFHYVLEMFRNYERRKYGAIKLDFAKGTYFDENQGLETNWWNYYFMPVDINAGNRKCLDHAVSNNFDYMRLATNAFGGFMTQSTDGIGISRKEAHHLFNKYFKLKPEIQSDIEYFFNTHLKGNYIISVHYRGTDKKTESTRIPYDEMINRIRDYIYANNLIKFKIFLATDEQAFADRLQEEFDNVAMTDAKRSTDGGSLHPSAHATSFADPFKRGREALIDCLLLAKGDTLIRTSSMLSLFSTYVNPDMPVVEVKVDDSEFY